MKSLIVSNHLNLSKDFYSQLATHCPQMAQFISSVTHLAEVSLCCWWRDIQVKYPNSQLSLQVSKFMRMKIINKRSRSGLSECAP